MMSKHCTPISARGVVPARGNTGDVFEKLGLTVVVLLVDLIIRPFQHLVQGLDSKD
jgi:hypothetical protein